MIDIQSFIVLCQFDIAFQLCILPCFTFTINDESSEFLIRHTQQTFPFLFLWGRPMLTGKVGLEIIVRQPWIAFMVG